MADDSFSIDLHTVRHVATEHLPEISTNMTDGTSAIQTVLGIADRAFANPMDKQNNEDWGALVEALMDALTKSAARIDAAAVVLGEFADAVELSDDANAVSLLNSVDQVGDVK